jgi:hypothetical protein
MATTLKFSWSSPMGSVLDDFYVATNNYLIQNHTIWPYAFYIMNGNQGLILRTLVRKKMNTTLNEFALLSWNHDRELAESLWKEKIETLKGHLPLSGYDVEIMMCDSGPDWTRILVTGGYGNPHHMIITFDDDIDAVKYKLMVS